MTDPTTPTSQTNPATTPATAQNAPLPSSLSLEQAARALQYCNRPFTKAPADDQTGALETMRDALASAFQQDGDCNTLLFTQAQVLDALFSRLLTKALESPYRERERANYINDKRVQLALRAQRQCRATVDTLALLKRKNAAQKQDKSTASPASTRSK